jgi:hypothetical protein
VAVRLVNQGLSLSLIEIHSFENSAFASLLR